MSRRLILFSLLAFSKSYGMNDRPIISFNHSSRPQQNSHLSLNDRVYINHELMRNKINSINFNTLYQKNELANIKSNYIASFNSVAGASKILNLETLKPFISNFANNPVACFDVQNQQVIDKLIPVLFNKLGYPKFELTPFEKYQVARIVTDYLHATNPKEYVSTIKQYIDDGHPEFMQVLKEETSLGSWIKQQTCIKPYALLQGFFDTTSFHGSALEFANVVNNKFSKHLAQVNSLASQGKFAEAKSIIDGYEKVNTDFEVQQYQALNKVYDQYMSSYCDRVCRAVDLKKPTPQVVDVIKRMPLCKTPQETARLIYETLAHNQRDMLVVEDMKKLLNEHGLPRCYTYDPQIAQNVSLSPYFTSEQIEDRVLLFDIALKGAKTAQEKNTLPAVAHYLEKACSDNALARCYSDLAHNTYDALKNPQSNEAVVLECGDFSKIAEAIPELDALQRRTVPLVANLINEIKRLDNAQGSDGDIARFKSELQKLDKLFQEAQFCPKAQGELGVIIARLNSELKTFSRPQLFRSPSMERLFKALGLDLVASTRFGRLTSEEIVYFSARIVEQKAIRHEMAEHLNGISLNAALNVKDERVELYKVHVKLLEAAQKLNDDFKTTLAKEGFYFAKDILKFIEKDNKLPNEILYQAGKALLHPIDYCAKTIEGIKNMAIGLGNLARHNHIIKLATPEEQFAYARSCNESLHAFFDNWKQLPQEAKREFIAQLIVDTALNKAIGSIPKLLINTTKFTELSSTLGDKFTSLGAQIPTIIDGSSALIAPAAEALGAVAEVAQDVGIIVVEGAASTPAAIGIAAQSSFDSLFDARNNNSNSGGGNGDNPLKAQERNLKVENFQSLTNKEARRIATEWGYVEKKPNFNTHGELAFQHPKTKLWISPDKDGHKGGVWKLYDRWGDREGTLDKFGKMIAT